jgi:hypothetical protein
MSLLWRRLIFFSLLINVWTFAQEPTILQRSLKTKREQNAAREAWFRHGRTLTPVLGDPAFSGLPAKTATAEPNIQSQNTNRGNGS